MNNSLVRLQLSKCTVYVEPEKPFWFIPNKQADDYLQKHDFVGAYCDTPLQGDNIAHITQLSAFLKSINSGETLPYSGRSQQPLKQLEELWIHITDDCNLACHHCLFSCKPDNQARSLKSEDIKKWINEAYQLGTRLVVFTGGEPFVHSEFVDILKWSMELKDLRIAVLTNGLLLSNKLAQLNNVDQSRLHFQISLDGLEKEHDHIRGAGNYKRAVAGLDAAKESGFSTSVVMAVNQENVEDMPAMIEAIHKMNVSTVHFMWHFVRGTGETIPLVDSKQLISNFKAAASQAKKLDITIDNIEAIRSQLFSPLGTRYDLTNAGFESIAIGPDGCVYPTPALIEVEDFNAGKIGDSLEDIWRHSTLLKKIRSASLLDVPGIKDYPWRFIVGGGDLDHAAYNRHDDELLGTDPYLPLYDAIIEMLLEEEIHDLPVSEGIGLILRMGDVSTDCPSGEDVNFTHCNCLLSMGDGDHRSLIRSFYAQRAQTPDETILNPVNYELSEVDFIPEEGRVRQYGCGSPVSDASLMPGQTLLDLGSGTGVEVFIAAKQVGSTGRAIGLDMTDDMLDVANRSKVEVAKSLGYDNIMFMKGFLESMPLEDNSVDVVISNCVINLTSNKRRVFKEILRILKPGGKLVISDVVTENEPALSIRADQKMKGECLGGAYVQEYLFTVMREIGFDQAQAIKRFPYRQVDNQLFYSMTYSAVKPDQSISPVEVMFAGPGKTLVFDNGEHIDIGERKAIMLPNLTPQELANKGLFIINQADGTISNIDGASSCCCIPLDEPESGSSSSDCGCDQELSSTAQSDCDCEESEQQVGCLICSKPLIYLDQDQELKCVHCGTFKTANAKCEQGHFVCDTCHSKHPLEDIKSFCLDATETDLMVLYRKFKARYYLPLHGPEHHILAPALILTAYKNAGGQIVDQDIITGINRAISIPGGMCGFMGICGAAVGAGIAFGLIQKSNPLNASGRQSTQRLVAQLGMKLSEIQAARCCQREVVTVLKQAAELSQEYLPISLSADGGFACEQFTENQQCIGATCPVSIKKMEEKAKDVVI